MSKVVAELKYSAEHEWVAAGETCGKVAVTEEGPLMSAAEYAAANGGEL